MKILISNDDGLEAEGIEALAKEMRRFEEVTVVAPHRERSTTSHSLTLHKPVRVDRRGEGAFAVSGTPADCIYLGVFEVMDEKPDYVLSGINRGANLGTDVHYSGTVAAAREAALMNIPSIAFSLVDLRQIQPHREKEPMRFTEAAVVARQVFQELKGVKFPDHTLINVNIPNLPIEEIRGVRVARQGIRYYEKNVIRRTDIRGKEYFWLGGEYEGFELNRNCDCFAVGEGYVSVTPLTIDVTDAAFQASLKETNLESIRFQA